MFKPIFKLATNLDKWAVKRAKESNKAMSLAMSKASFDLRKTVQMELKTGKLGLKPLSYLTVQPTPKKGRRRKKRRSDRAALTGLFRGVTYYVDRRRLIAEIGFRGIGGTAWTKKLAERSLEGYRWHYTEERRAALHKIGVHLRPSTSFGRVPPRDVMGEAKEKHQAKFFKQVKVLYLRKMAGERI